jgi:zinc protease
MRLTLRCRDGQVALVLVLAHAVSAALALIAAPALASPVRPAVKAEMAAAATPASLSVPPLAFTRRTLANGLEVLALPGGGSGSVSVQMWFRVGGKDDPAGRSGFAHLFEHLMFKGTKYMVAEQFDRLTEDVGGNNNAFTAEDTTAYHSVVPSNHLERLLWAEAERLAHLNVDEANFKSERKVVQEEFRQRVLADPYGLLFNAIAPNAYSVHPYRRPVIGSIADLDAATLDDVRAFHATYYRPDNAVLIVSGDFDPAQLNAWVDRYFGPLTHPDTPVPRVSVKEPERKAARTVEVQGPNVPLPAVLLTWQGPPSDHPDVAALEVAQALLAGGESSRLNQALVYRQRIAQAAGFQSDLHTDAGSVVAYAIAAGRTPPDKLAAPLMREIQALADGPISAAEMDKVKTQLLTAALTARQTALGLGQALGWAVISRHDPQALNRELDELQAVTAADVQRVLRRYVLGHPAVTLHYTQAPRPTAAQAAQPEAK